MLDAIKMIRDAERLAENLLNEAKSQADRIRSEPRLDTVYRKTYDETIAETKRKKAELVKEMRDKAEREAKNVLQTVKTQIEELQEKAEKNFQKAVDFILNEFRQLIEYAI